MVSVSQIMMMSRSGGGHHGGWEDEYYQRPLRALEDFEFVPKVFVAGPAVSTPVRDGLVETEPYVGQGYLPSKQRVVEGAWDHETCYVCEWRIDEGYSYWQNQMGVCVCEVCHDYIAEHLSELRARASKSKKP
jgi:hypothetical protein